MVKFANSLIAMPCKFKTISIFLVALFVQAAYGQDASQSLSTMVFDAEVWDFGTIKEADGPVSHTFTFTNTGSQAFVIERTAVDCGCTTPDYSKRPILPGGKGEVTVTYDPAGVQGAFMRQVIIGSNNGQNRNVIVVRGEVVPRIKTVEEEFPYDMGGGIRLSRIFVNFGQIGQGRPVSTVVQYVNTSQRDVRVELKLSDDDDYFIVDMPSTACAGCRGDLTLTYDLSTGRNYGHKRHNVYFMTDGVQHKPNMSITATAILADDFSRVAQDNAPVAEIEPTFHQFGDVAGERVLGKEFVLTNTGKSDLVIRSVEYKGNVSSTLREGQTIAPGARVRATLSLDVTGMSPGVSTGSVVLILNDPARPYREIRLGATVK